MLAAELHKPVRKHFQRRHVDVLEIDDVWAADLIEMQEWYKENRGYRYMLNAIDIFTKFAYSIPLKDKMGATVLDAFKDIVKQSKRLPRHIWVDEGKEFYNIHMTEWLRENNIIRYSTHGEHKSAVVERFNRTLKAAMWKRFTAENTRTWIDMLNKLLHDYNNRFHSTIGMTPTQASMQKNAIKVLQNTIDKTRITPKAGITFKVGDKVRVSRLKGTFEHGYLPNWSEELFTVEKIKRTTPVTYIIKDSLGEIIQGSFYTEELQKSAQDVYRVEKVIRKKKINGVEHALVKWMGHSEKFNQWIPAADLKVV